MKILVLSATTGAGHMKAAEAIKKDLESKDGDIEVYIIDAIKYINTILNWIIVKGYIGSVKYAPRIFGKLYYDTDKDSLLAKFVEKLNGIFSKKLIKLIDEIKPEYIVSTHPFATEMVSNLKSKDIVKIPLICTITDYAPHHLWIDDNVDAYLVACEEMVENMRSRGVDIEKIYPYGIPVDPIFIKKINKTAVLKSMGLKEDKPVLLLMCGSFGVNNILEIYNDLIKSNADFQIVAVCGSNEKLHKKLLKESEKNKNKEIKILGFSDEINKLMQISDILITKPGGMTISEALNVNIPMLVFDAIPGQEEKNAEFLISKGVGISIGNGKTCRHTVEKLLNNREELQLMKENCNNFNKEYSFRRLLNEFKNK